MTKSVFNLYLVITLVSFVHCTKETEEDDSCPDRNLGTYHLVVSHDDYIPYDQKALLKFVNSLGNDLTLVFNPNINGYTEYQRDYNVLCNNKITTWPVDLNKFEYYIHDVDSALTYYWHLELNKLAQPDKYGEIKHLSDYLQLTTIYKNVTYYGPQIYWYIAENDSVAPTPVNSRDSYFYPTISLLNKNFDNVYMQWDSMLYYSFQDGIVAFRDPTRLKNNSSLWVLDAVIEIPD